MRRRNRGNVSAAAAWRRHARRTWMVVVAVATTLVTLVPNATAKPDPHPLTTWSSYQVCDSDCTGSDTVFLRADASRPALDIYGSGDPSTVYTIRLVRFYEANADTLAPYTGTELNLLTPSWTLSQPVVAPYREGYSLDFSYATGPRRHRYGGMEFTFHATPSETGINLKIDTHVHGYQWQSSDPTAALVLEAQVLVNGLPVSSGPETFVFSHFDGDLNYDPPLI